MELRRWSRSRTFASENRRSRLVEPLECRTLLSASTLRPVADADVQNLDIDASIATANFGGDDDLRVRIAAGESFESFLTFDISQISAVAHAVLKLHGGQSGTITDNVTVGAFRATSNFVEGDGIHIGPLDLDANPAGEITWNTRPGSTGGAVAATLVYDVGDYYLNLTPYIQEAKAAGQTLVTVGLRHVGGGTGLVSFGSREGNGGQRPELIVEENTGGPAATFFSPDITNQSGAGAATQQIVITYTDSDAIDVNTIDTGDIEVRPPSGPALDVTSLSVQQADANSVIATYTVAAPGSTWDATDSPVYTTILKDAAVKDILGNPAVGGPDVFTVVIDPATPPPADTQAPVATFTQVPSAITEEGGTGTTIAVKFTDDVGVVTDALTTSSLSVVPRAGTVLPGGSAAPLQVLDVDVQPSPDGKTATATFNVIAPGGAWDPIDNNTYDVTIASGAATDAAGNASPAVATTFSVSVPVSQPPPPPGGPTPTPTPPPTPTPTPIPDTVGPVATVVPLNVITEDGATEQQIRVTYVDAAGTVDLATVDLSDILITAPDGSTLGVTDVSVSPPTGGASVTATYTIVPAGGTWDFSDNGIYTVSVPAGAVKDNSGNGNAAGTGTFEVANPSPEPPVDPNFGGGGSSTVNTGFVAEAAAPQADGKILIVGRQGDLSAGTSQLVLQRLNADGSFDTSFGNGGKVLGAEGANEAAFAVVVDADGNILVGGRRGDDLMVARYKSNGTLDTRFGVSGVAVADFGGIDVAYSLVIGAADGSIVAAGGSTQGASDAFAFARFTRDGQADPFFGTNGRALFAAGNSGNVAGSVAIDSQGRIVAAGPSDDGKVAVVRLNTNGIEDTSFGTAGVIVIDQLVTQNDLGRPDRSIGVVAQPDGSVLVTNRTPGEGDFAVARVAQSGMLDTSFGGGDGITTIDFGGEDDADQILIQGTGEIIVLGTTTAGGNRVAVAALGPDGSLLPTFGEQGKLTVELTPIESERALHVGDLVLRAFGSFTTGGQLIVGASNQAPAAASSTRLQRLNVPGSGLLRTFGQNGAKRAKPVQFADADGTVVTISMKGPGAGQVFHDGATLDLVLSGVNNSSIVIKTSGGTDGRVVFRNVQADGTIKSINAKTTDVTGTFAVTNGGGLGKVSIGTLTGTLASAGPITSLAFAGDVRGKVFSGANYGVNGKAGGTGTAADTFAAGRIGKVTVAGNTVGATFAAGVDPVNSRLLDGNDILVGGSSSSIGTIAVKKGADASTRFVAGAFAKKAKLPKPVDTSNDPRFMQL